MGAGLSTFGIGRLETIVSFEQKYGNPSNLKVLEFSNHKDFVLKLVSKSDNIPVPFDIKYTQDKKYQIGDQRYSMADWEMFEDLLVDISMTLADVYNGQYIVRPRHFREEEQHNVHEDKCEDCPDYLLIPAIHVSEIYLKYFRIDTYYQHPEPYALLFITYSQNF